MNRSNSSVRTRRIATDVMVGKSSISILIFIKPGYAEIINVQGKNMIAVIITTWKIKGRDQIGLDLRSTISKTRGKHCLRTRSSSRTVNKYVISRTIRTSWCSKISTNLWWCSKTSISKIWCIVRWIWLLTIIYGIMSLTSISSSSWGSS